MPKSFWQLIEDEKCGECGNAVIKVDDEHYYCPRCKSVLSLCGNWGKCEGIAYNWPVELQDGQLVDTNPKHDGCGWCDSCGSQWEWA